jgi:hypothetical protein
MHMDVCLFVDPAASQSNPWLTQHRLQLTHNHTHPCPEPHLCKPASKLSCSSCCCLRSCSNSPVASANRAWAASSSACDAYTNTQCSYQRSTVVSSSLRALSGCELSNSEHHSHQSTHGRYSTRSCKVSPHPPSSSTMCTCNLGPVHVKNPTFVGMILLQLCKQHLLSLLLPSPGALHFGPVLPPRARL